MLKQYLISETEKFYFRPHTKEVLSISRKLSALVGFDEETEKRMSFIALLHNHYLIGSPDKYSIIDPRFSSKDEAEKFDTHLKRSAANLANIEMLTDVAKLTALIYENMDGSGKPNG